MELLFPEEEVNENYMKLKKLLERRQKEMDVWN